MTKLLTSLALAASLLTVSAVSNADPPKRPRLGPARTCSPGQQVTCSCGDNAQGTATCDSNGAAFSACACAKVSVSVPAPVVKTEIDVRGPDIRVGVPNVFVNVPGPPNVRVKKRKRRPSEPTPPLVFLIGGACTLGTGAFNVAFGADRIRRYGKDPFGIVSVSLGGTAMLVGLPLTIIGIVKYASQPKEPEKEAPKKDTGVRFVPTADGFALHF